MTRLTILAAAAAALAFPAVASAQDDPALAAFETVCVASGGNYAQMLSAATSGGWTDTQVVPETDTAVSITSQAAREKTVDGVTLTLLVNQGLRHTRSGDVPQSVCKISDGRPDPGVITRSTAWLGFAQDSGDATLAVYYVKPGGVRPAHVPSDGLNAAMAAGGFSIIKVQQDQGSAIFVYTTYSK
jgi:hypothetical protein